MIIYKENKGFETRSDKPNENWTSNQNVFIIPDNSELANKVIEAYPYYEFVVDEVGNLIDITPTEKPIEIPQPTTDDYLLDLDYRVSMVELGL